MGEVARSIRAAPTIALLLAPTGGLALQEMIEGIRSTGVVAFSDTRP